MERLLDAGANVRLANSAGKTAVRLAVIHNNTDIFQTLLWKTFSPLGGPAASIEHSTTGNNEDIKKPEMVSSDRSKKTKNRNKKRDLRRTLSIHNRVKSSDLKGMLCTQEDTDKDKEEVLANEKNEEDVLAEFILKKEYSDIFIYVYPYITDGDKIFETILSLLKRDETSFSLEMRKLLPDRFLRISDILHSFYLTRFPYGIPSESEIQFLNGILDHIKAPIKLRNNLLVQIEILRAQTARHMKIDSSRNSGVSNKNSRREKTILLDNIIELWNKTDVATLNQILTERDRDLFQSLSLQQLKLWLFNHQNNEVVTKLGLEMERQVNFYAFIILREKTHQQQLVQAKKLISLGSEFARINNLWGVIQVVSALEKFHNNRPINVRALKGFNDLELLTNPSSNFRNYRRHISKIRKLPCIPMINVTQKDLWAWYEHRKLVGHDIDKVAEVISINSERNLTINLEPGMPEDPFQYLLDLAKILQPFGDWLNLSTNFNYGASRPGNLSLVNLPFISEEVISEFFTMHSATNKELIESRPPPNAPLASYSSATLFAWLRESAAAKIIPQLLENYIWTGLDLFEILKNPKDEVKRKRLAKIDIDDHDASTIIELTRNLVLVKSKSEILRSRKRSIRLKDPSITSDMASSSLTEDRQ